MENLLTRQELADRLKVSVTTLDRYSIPRILLGDRLVRYREQDVAKWMEDRKQVREKIQIPAAPPLVLVLPKGKHRKTGGSEWLPRKTKGA